jgi:hypothetical protein
MSMSFSVGAGLRVSAVVLAIVALSPAPLVLPSGVAVAVIGLMGAVAIVGAVAARSALGQRGCGAVITW